MHMFLTNDPFYKHLQLIKITTDFTGGTRR